MGAFSIRRTPFYANDFQVTFENGIHPLDLATWLEMGIMVQGSFPDIKVVIDDIHTDGNSVILAIHFKATFTHPLDLSVLGLGVIPATGAPVKFLINTNRFSFEGDKIERMYNMDIGPYTGVSGFLKDVSVPIS